MITMTGFDRTFEVPQNLRAITASAGTQGSPALRAVVSGRVSVWDMLSPSMADAPALVRAWGDRLVDSVLTASAAQGRTALECEDCEDTGYYAVPDPRDPDILRTLVRRIDDSLYSLQASGEWRDWSGPEDIELLDLETAEAMSSAIMAGASGLALRYFHPLAFLSPDTLIAAADPASALAPDAEGWHHFAIVDELDTGAVLNLVRIKPGPVMEKYDQAGIWSEDSEILTQLKGVKPPPLVELSETDLKDVITQIDSGAVAAEDGAGGTDAPPADSDQPAGDTGAPQTAAGALVADAPLTVSPDPRAEKLRRYWSTGKGGLKIRWGTPGDWTRCFRQLKKHMGERAKGYCANLHKRNTGKWTGSKLNASGGMMMVMSTEEALVASVRAGTWTGRSERVLNMTGIKDGVYEEAVGGDHSVVRSLTAGGFPVDPPDEWFTNPQLASLTPLTVEDNGHVFGHLASFDMPHIGLPGKVRAPKSRSNYGFFKTGQVRTASGGKVDVGNLTLVGGHAPLSADASMAVKHYDDTNSAVADVNIGEDRHGIWFSGALRPDVTPSQVRAFMASALSGDWRPINGNLELVAACSVNVPGFPIAKTMVAGGAVMALVAAGARPVALKQFARASDMAVMERLDYIEALLADANLMVAPNEVPVEEIISDPADLVSEEEVAQLERDINLPDPVDIRTGTVVDETPAAAAPEVAVATTETKTVNPKREAARELIKARKREERRARVHGAGADAAPKALAPELTEGEPTS